MKRFRHSRPRPALIVAVLALVAALAGTAVASDPVANTALSKKKTKKVAKKQADKQIDAREAGLSVLNAEQLAGLPADEYQSRVRWALVNPAAGSILAQSGGVTLETGSAGFSYLDWGEDIGSRAIEVTNA